MKARYLPPEWTEQSAVLLAWPNETGPFADWHADAESTYGRIAFEISRRETVIIACPDDILRRSIQVQLSTLGADPASIRFVSLDYDDVWVRDTAPLTVETDQNAVLMNFRFNGWGEKYPCRHDSEFGERLLRSGTFDGIASESLRLVLEGGSIESDGRGTLLTTRFCLSNPNRNPSMSQAEIEATLKKRLGVRRLLWLNHGQVVGDDTDAHVDTLARFCDEETIAFTACEDPADEHYASLSAMTEELRSFRTEAGDSYRLVPLPLPKPIRAEDGARLPATYANFLIINDAVLVPAYDDANDEVATERLSDCFPTREIISIDCRTLIRQYGSLHCMTMQFPKSVRLAPQ